jgi:alkanesulfonate monooxygenase SsuD/methylene tetrahydromethanopterin reductase-like flavin-dependent oxidoreductase (luciferase family)
MTRTFGLGVQLAAQDARWSQLLAAAVRADALGYDHIWLPDHLVPIHGIETSPIFEAYTALGAIAASTSRAGLGLLVGANTFRNPAVRATTIVTLDHISDGRALLGIGAGWYAREHEAYGIDFGTSAGDRLDRLDEALSIIRPLLAGAEVTHGGPTYRTDRLRLVPGPVHGRLPILVGGVGERKTLRTVARYADMWNAQVALADAPHKLDVLDRHCAEVGRDPGEIERTLDCAVFIRDTEHAARAALEASCAALRVPAPDPASPFWWTGTPEQIADRMRAFTELGFSAITCEFAPPYDEETLVRLAEQVRPLVAH